MSDIKILNALLFDTRSIQKYIFSGNRLSTNIGASFIVDKVFTEILVGEVLTKFFPAENFSTTETVWNPAEDNRETWTEIKDCAVAYIGGGNAMILFNAEKTDVRKQIVAEFTRKLLAKRPGLKVGVAHGKLTITDGKLNQSDIDNLYKKLKATQNKIFPAVNVPYNGLTLSSDIDGEVANFFDTKNIVNKEGGEIRFYSQETAVKAKKSFAANENLKDRFKEIFAVKNFEVDIENYKFPVKIDELGQKEKENYFAIVHVDGNNMGVKFRSCETLTDRRKLSREIRRKTEGAFADLLRKIILAVDEKIFGDTLSLEENYLPIRPLILGGDDVTFICPAKMAILFTKTLMENLNSLTPENSPEHLTQDISKKIDCCAGIAILPTAYPFFRGYQLAEQLCDSAKSEMRRDKNSASSWLDFAILHGEQAPSLKQIRENDYKGAIGNLHFGAYTLADNKNSRRKNIENLLSAAKYFSTKIPRGKVKELRFVLARGDDDIARFLAQLNHQNLKMPEIEDWKNYLQENLFSGEKEKQTPYIDAIEIIDFYDWEAAEKWQNLK